jgi:hypothetical protein
MSNNPPAQNTYPLPSNSYAAFDAIALRNLIIDRLNTQGTFTDQNYIGSNLASVIDIVSFAYNSLIYYLNKTSTESTFTEAQLYENVNRIVKILDYKPVGFQTSTLTFQASANKNFSIGSYTIPRYSYLTLGSVAYSFNEDVSFNITTNNVITPLTELSNTILMYQGIYRENPLYTAVGDLNEVVSLTVTNTNVDHFNIDVYVFEQASNAWYEYTNVANLYTETANARSYEKRLNQSGTYEFTFGDGINGRRLQVGDLVSIYALQGSGTAGIIGPGTLGNLNATPVIFNTNTFSQIWPTVTSAEQYNAITSNLFNNIFFNNAAGSTLPVQPESVDSIRNHAPSNFKSQYRLVTKEDYETFISTNFANFISDVTILDNWDYTGKYLKYFSDIQAEASGFKQILLNQVLYADSCNFNNIYVCAVPKTSFGTSLKYLLPAQKELILTDINSRKVISTEITFLDPVYKAVGFGVPEPNGTISSINTKYFQLQIVRNTTSSRSNNSILNEVQNIFNTFFDISNAKIGDMFDYNSLLTSILSVDGVNKLKTVKTSGSGVTFDGLSFFVWNPVYPDLDIKQVTNTTQANPFDILYFNDISNIVNSLVVVTS